MLKMKHMKNKTYAGFLRQHSEADNISSAQREPEPHVEYIRHENNEHAFDCIPPPLLLESICSVFFFPPKRLLSQSLHFPRENN